MTWLKQNYPRIINWLSKNWLKAVGVLTILFIVNSYINYLEDKNNLAELKYRGQQEQDKKEYMAERKNDCLNIYKTEGAKWNNVRGWRYDEDSDLCYISYKDPNQKSKAECEKNIASSREIFSPNPVPPSIFGDYLRCLDGTFENSF